MKEKKCGKNWIYALMAAVLLTGALDFSKGNAAEASQPETESLSAGNLQREVIPDPEAPESVTESAPSELAQLQIPQRMEIVIDPWQIDGKEQIYSEEYTVRNTGETPGILILDFTCKIGEEAGLTFQEDPDGLRDSGEKRLHMKALFGNGEEVVFTREGTRYQEELQPGETLTLRFTGEINETAEEPWKDGDLEIEGIYSWERETVRFEAENEISEIEEDTVSENVVPEEMEGDAVQETVSQDKDKEGESGEEQTLPGKPEQGTDKGNSLSGNELEE